MATKRRSVAQRDVLESPTITRAEAVLKDSDTISPIISDAIRVLKQEITTLRFQGTTKGGQTPSKSVKPVSSGTHPAVTGLSIGGAKEVLDYILAIAVEGDKIGQGLLELPFIDGGITAIIATVAAWLAKGNKKK
jgi:hypothetical protein